MLHETVRPLLPTSGVVAGNANGKMQNYVPSIRAHFDKMASARDFDKLLKTPLSNKYPATQ